MLVYDVRNRLVLLVLKSVPLFINYDVIWSETLQLNNFAKSQAFGHFSIDICWLEEGLHAYHNLSQTIKSLRSY